MEDSGVGGTPVPGVARHLSKPQQDVLTELQKILLTLKQINESLTQTIELTSDGGSATERRLRKSTSAAVEAGKEAFGALAEEVGEDEGPVGGGEGESP